MGYLLGIDLGSTSIKAVAYDLAGNIVASHSVAAEIKHLDSDHPAWAFWDPDIVWNSTLTVIRSVLDQIGNAADIKGIAVTGIKTVNGSTPLSPGSVPARNRKVGLSVRNSVRNKSFPLPVSRCSISTPSIVLSG